jgi:hypothetical protein
MNATDPIRQVSVVSTGQVQIRPDHEASSWRPAIWWLLAGHQKCPAPGSGSACPWEAITTGDGLPAAV